MSDVGFQHQDGGFPEDRPLPNNIEAEQTLLGSLLMHSDAALDDVASLLEPDDFYEPIHAEIYNAIITKFQRGEQSTLMSVKPHLAFMDSDDDFKEIGGTKYLAKLCGMSGGFLSVRDYAKAVKDASMRRGLVLLSKEIESKAYDAPVEITPAEIVEELEGSITRLASLSDRSEPVSAVSVALEVVGGVRAVTEGRSPPKGITSGLNAYDAANGPMMPGDLIVIGGATSMGKTALVQQLLWNAAKSFQANDDGERVSGARCAAFSMEMSKEQYITRHLAQVADLDSEAIERGNLSLEKLAALEQAAHSMEGLPLWIEDGRGLKTVRIRSTCRRHKRKHGLDLVLIDHLGFVASPHFRMSSVEAKEHNVAALKALAMELNCPVLLISHLNRGLWARDDKRPQLSDLHGASAIEKDADVVTFVHRDDYYLLKTKPEDLSGPEYLEWADLYEKVKGKAEIINAKRRRGRPGLSFTCLFNDERTTFSNIQNTSRGEL